MRAPWREPVLRRRRLPAAGPDAVREAVREAGELVASGHPVALEPVPGPDPAGVLAALVDAAADAGPAGSCRVTVPLGALADEAVAALVRRAEDAGLGADLAGPPDRVRSLAGQLPAAGAVVVAAAPGAERVCRELAGGRVRLLGRGRRAGGRSADLAFVRCLNVLMAASGHPGVATSDPRLVAIAGERAAWNERDPESWEYVMRQGVRVAEQRRLLAAGQTVRVVVTAGAGR